jgi:hypothetical protein
MGASEEMVRFRDGIVEVPPRWSQHLKVALHNHSVPSKRLCSSGLAPTEGEFKENVQLDAIHSQTSFRWYGATTGTKFLAKV